jgi:hypothetical protein
MFEKERKRKKERQKERKRERKVREIVLRMQLCESERVCSMDHVTHRRKAQEKLYVCV